MEDGGPYGTGESHPNGTDMFTKEPTVQHGRTVRHFGDDLKSHPGVTDTYFECGQVDVVQRTIHRWGQLMRHFEFPK